MKMTVGKISAILVLAALSSCSTVRSVFVTEEKEVKNLPILNPFGVYYNGSGSSGGPQNMVFRSKKGERSVEVEFPSSNSDNSNFVIPVSPAFTDSGRRPASGNGEVDDSYLERKPSSADREITHSFPQISSDDEQKRREVESGLGLVPSQDNPTPDSDKSYLAATDHVKQLYKLGRFEAALIETEELLRSYPTDPRLHQMRGTLLSVLGKNELALKSWSQALRLDPGNGPLRRFIERKQRIAGGVQ